MSFQDSAPAMLRSSNNAVNSANEETVSLVHHADRADHYVDDEQKVDSAQLAAGNGRLVVPILSTAAAAIGTVLFGYVLGYTSPVALVLPIELQFTADQFSLFSSFANVGAMIGALFGGSLSDRFGRRITIQLSAVPYALGWFLLSWADGFAMAFVARIFCGIGVGFASVCVPVYIAEIAPAKLRGGFGVVTQLGIVVGILLVYAIGLAITWRWLARLGAILALVMMLLLFFAPQTPKWLVTRNRFDDARAALRRLRGPHYDIDVELRATEDLIASTNSGRIAGQGGLSWFCSRLCRRSMLMPLIVSIALMIWQQFSGINAVVFYASAIFLDAGIKDPTTSSLAVSGAQTLVTFISVFLVDKAGRRTWMTVAGSGMALSSLGLGIFFYLKNVKHEEVQALALVCLILYIAFFSVGLGALPWVVMSEIFPQELRGFGSSISTLVNWTCAFVVTQTFDSMKSGLTTAGVFWFYSGIIVAGVIFVRLVCPETKGQSLEQIQAYFEKREA